MTADIVIESFEPGYMDNLGLGNNIRSLEVFVRTCLPERSCRYYDNSGINFLQHRVPPAQDCSYDLGEMTL